MLISINNLFQNNKNAGAITANICNNFLNKSPKWKVKTATKIKKLANIFNLSYFDESFWYTFKQLKTFLKNGDKNGYIREPIERLLQDLQIYQSKKVTNEIGPSEPKEKSESPSTCNDFYALLRLKCSEYKLKAPIILYGRLFEEERFQYISFIFGQRVFIFEISTESLEIQERACEAMCALIRKHGGLDKYSSLVKIQNNEAYVVAEIDIQTQNIIFCNSTPMDLILLNLNEIFDLIAASNYLVNVPYAWISDTCTETLFYKQYFLEGIFINDNVFGCVEPSKKNIFGSTYQIVLVICDKWTQSNFLWNKKPLTIDVKSLLYENYLFSNMSYQHIELQQENENVENCGGVRFGHQILYDGPLEVIFD